MGRKVQTWHFSDVNNVEVWFLNKFKTNIIRVYGSGKSNERAEVVGFCGLDADRIKQGWEKEATALLASTFLPTV